MDRNCPKCKQNKPLTSENFYKNKSEVGGFQYTCKECHKNYYKRKSWKNPNKEEQRLKENLYRKNKWENDPEWRLLQLLRIRLNQSLKKGDQHKSIDFLGCSPKEWKEYLESQFDEDMTWDNHGDYWEIDHIIPISKGGSFHYTNTQPLIKVKNRQKYNNYG